MKYSKTIYLDTSIPSFLFDERESIKFFIDVTKEFWDLKAKEYKFFISEQTIFELSRGNYPKKEEVLAFAFNFEILPFQKEIADIVEVYVANKLMPIKDLGDSFHLAYTSFYKIDYLLTWNYKHLANVNKQHQIRFINNKLGLLVPEIITPIQLMEE